MHYAQVAAVLRARERDEQRQPLDRAAQLEQAARESQQRGEIECVEVLFF
jgi:flagellar biosynthesis regulator FlaF